MTATVRNWRSSGWALGLRWASQRAGLSKIWPTALADSSPSKDAAARAARGRLFSADKRTSCQTSAAVSCLSSNRVRASNWQPSSASRWAYQASRAARRTSAPAWCCVSRA